MREGQAAQVSSETPGRAQSFSAKSTGYVDQLGTRHTEKHERGPVPDRGLEPGKYHPAAAVNALAVTRGTACRACGLLTPCRLTNRSTLPCAQGRSVRFAYGARVRGWIAEGGSIAVCAGYCWTRRGAGVRGMAPYLPSQFMLSRPTPSATMPRTSGWLATLTTRMPRYGRCGVGRNVSCSYVSYRYIYIYMWILCSRSLVPSLPNKHNTIPPFTIYRSGPRS